MADARDFVSRHLRENDLSGEVDTVRLVVSELATNAVVHAATPFTVTVGRDDESLTVAVSDSSLVPLHGPSRQPTTMDWGRGLHIVEALSSSWGVTAERDGKSVWATFDLPEPGDLHPPA